MPNGRLRTEISTLGRIIPYMMAVGTKSMIRAAVILPAMMKKFSTHTMHQDSTPL
ncbi:hypothetical protein BJX70DRAFT_380755 [Aspergillus crustosus]